MKVLAIIPARGGSKGVPGKNIKLLGGIPLLAHAIKCAQGAKKVNKIVVTTDAQEIIDVALNFNAEVIKRPTDLATDTSNVVTAVQHVLNALNESYDVIVLLQPTSPLRTSADLDNIIEMLINNPQTDGVISVVPFDDLHPARMYNIDNEKNLTTYIQDGETLRRQDLTPVYYRNGCFYAVKTKAFLTENSFMVKNKKAYVMEVNWLANIDAPRDFKIAELLYEDWKNENCNNRK